MRASKTQFEENETSAKRTISSLVAVALLSTLASACLDYPRNGQSLDTKTTVVQFEGWYFGSNIEVTLWIWNNATSDWEAIPHGPILSGASGYTDNAGDTWSYYAADDVVLPQGAKYWAAGAGRNVSAKVKATGPGGYDLTSYDVNADDCINQYKPEGGAAIMQHCKSSASPSVTLNVPCGAASGICCLAPSPLCDFGKNCSSGTCSATCGAQGKTCCQASPGCGGSTVCQNNACVHCGSTGETCCSGSACSSGNLCQGGSCVACGGPGQICCANNACASSGNVCKGGSCVSCGGHGQICCGGSSCASSGDVCKGGSCVSCGGQGQPCCGGSSCSAGLACSGGTCAVPPCGGAYQACCAGDTCPGSTDPQPLRCSTVVHKCNPCGNAGQPCCFLDSNPPYGCSGNLSCMNSKCQCDPTYFPNGCG